MDLSAAENIVFTVTHSNFVTEMTGLVYHIVYRVHEVTRYQISCNTGSAIRALACKLRSRILRGEQN